MITLHSLIFPLLIRICGVLDMLSGQNIELAQGLCQIFSCLGECNLEFIVQGSAEARACVDAITRCAAIPSKEVSAMTYNFFFLLSDQIIRREQSCTTTEEKNAVKSLFIPYYERLVECARRGMRYPPNVLNWNEEEEEYATRYRYYAADALTDARVVIGTERALQQITQTLISTISQWEAGNADWQDVESALYCIRCIGEKVDYEENNFVPQIMQLIPTLSQKLPKNQQVERNGSKSSRRGSTLDSPELFLDYTCVLIVGKYADWISKHQAYLPALLTYVVSSLNEKPLQGAAALAFKQVCESCKSLLCNETVLRNLFVVYSGSLTLHLTDGNEIVEGLVHVVTDHSNTHLQQSVVQLFQPITADIEASIALLTANPTNKGLNFHLHLNLVF